MKKISYIFAVFSIISLLFNLNAAVLEKNKEIKLPLLQVLRPERCLRNNLIAYILNSASKEEINAIKSSQNKELLKYIAEFFEDFKEKYGNKLDSIPDILPWKWFDILNIQLIGHTDCIKSISISHNSKFIVTASYDNTVKIWDSKTGNLIKSLDHNIDSITISYNDKFIIIALFDVLNDNYKLKIINSENGNLIKSLNYVCYKFKISHNNKFIATAANNTLNIMDTDTFELIKSLEHNNIHSITISHNDKFIVTTSFNNTVKIWDTDTGNLIRSLDHNGIHIRSITISHNDKFIVTSSVNPDFPDIVKIWDSETGDLINSLNILYISDLKISHNDKFIIIFSSKNTLQIFDSNNLDLIHKCLYSESIDSIVISHDDTFIIAFSKEKNQLKKNFSIKIFDSNTGELIKILNDVYSIMPLEISYDDTFIVTANGNVATINSFKH